MYPQGPIVQPRSQGPGEDPGNEVADCYFIVNVLDLSFASPIYSEISLSMYINQC